MSNVNILKETLELISEGDKHLDSLTPEQIKFALESIIKLSKKVLEEYNEKTDM